MLDLNLVKETPDSTWTIILQDTLTNTNDIDENSKIYNCIVLLNNNNIPYISYSAEHVSGLRIPKYSNILSIFVKDSDFERVTSLLEENNILFDKEAYEIDELKYSEIEPELSEDDLPRFNRFILTCGEFFSIGLFIFVSIILVFMGNKLKPSTEKSIMFAFGAIFSLFALLQIRSFLKKKQK